MLVGFLACRAWILVKEGKAKLMVHEDHCRLYQYHRALQVWIDQSGPKEERGHAVQGKEQTLHENL